MFGSEDCLGCGGNVGGLAGRAGGASPPPGGGGGGGRFSPLLTFLAVIVPLNGDAPRGPIVFALFSDLPNSFVPGRCGMTGGLVGRFLSGLTSRTEMERVSAGTNGFGVKASRTICLPNPVGATCCSVGFAGILGFSALFIGGGTRANGFGGATGSGRLYSPDLLGGGGSGGKLYVVGPSNGDLAGSPGVVGLLGILNARPGCALWVPLSPAKKSKGFGVVM